jgi:hypothetical protein
MTPETFEPIKAFVDDMLAQMRGMDYQLDGEFGCGAEETAEMHREIAEREAEWTRLCIAHELGGPLAPNVLPWQEQVADYERVIPEGRLGPGL